MTEAGYGVLRDGEAAGIWPLSLTEALIARDRYRKRFPDSKVDAVPILFGAPIERAVYIEPMKESA